MRAHFPDAGVRLSHFGNTIGHLITNKRERRGGSDFDLHVYVKLLLVT